MGGGGFDMFENSNYHTLTIYILVITAIIGPLAAGAEKNRDFDCNFDIFPLEKHLLETSKSIFSACGGHIFSVVSEGGAPWKVRGEYSYNNIINVSPPQARKNALVSIITWKIT